MKTINSIAYLLSSCLALACMLFQPELFAQAERNTNLISDEMVFTLAEKMPVFGDCANYPDPYDGRNEKDRLKECSQRNVQRYINEHLKYPERALEEKIQGRVTLSLIIDKNGEVKNVAILREMNNCPECNQEALKLVENMPKWKAGQQRENPVHVKSEINVSFKLPKGQ